MATVESSTRGCTSNTNWSISVQRVVIDADTDETAAIDADKTAYTHQTTARNTSYTKTYNNNAQSSANNRDGRFARQVFYRLVE
jgi:hypothetical protein